ncbi:MULTISPECIES: hypothetical protein [unclassified Devosia]|uniref:hypothetical protein n=2 Tax=Devosia TaxID=46913 RepID=UPI000AE45133|nr:MULTISPECIES: hypothetical protein [unclassified Devosia]
MIDSVWARPGVKCVCVDGSRPMASVFPGKPPIEVGGTFPVTGQIYTIESVVWHVSGLPWVGDFLGVHLMEINREPGGMTGMVVPYRIERFRPLVDDSRERDLALFTPLLDPEEVEG